MTFMEAVAAVAWANSAFKTACPGGIAAQLTPEAGTRPVTTYRVIGGPSDPTFDTAGLQQLRVEFNCISTVYREAFAARAALVKALNGPYLATIGDGSYLQGVEVISPEDFMDSDTREHRCMVEFYLYYNEVS